MEKSRPQVCKLALRPQFPLRSMDTSQGLRSIQGEAHPLRMAEQ
jgi:hypothetical protein